MANNVVNRLVPFCAVKQDSAKGAIHVLREIRPAPKQPMLERRMLSGEPKRLEEEKLAGFSGKCGNPWCATGDWGITFNGKEIAEDTPEGLFAFTKEKCLLDRLGERVLVQGGHFIPDLRGASEPAWATYGLEIALKVVELAWQREKKADLFVLVNDLSMGARPKNREEYWLEFALPKEMQAMIAACRERVGKSFNVLVAGESFLSNHMQKYVIPKLGEEMQGKIGDAIVERNNGKRTEKDERERGQRKCRAAIAQLHAFASRFYDGLVQVYPACGRGQGERALEVFRQAFEKGTGTALNVMNIYAGKKCWGAGCFNDAAKEKANRFLHELLDVL